jgi:hypothetical protein
MATKKRIIVIKEGAKLDKFKARAKKAVTVGMTAANLYTAGDITSRMNQGDGDPKRDMVSAASMMPGAAGWAATGVHYARKAYDKYQVHKEEIMTTRGNKHITEAFNNLFEGKLDEMRTNIKTSLGEKVTDALENRKREIAENYFAQHQTEADTKTE